MIRVGIIGTGNTVGIAHYHAQGLKNDGRAEITAVYNKEQCGVEQWVSQHGISPAICESYEEFLDKVDAICICTPNRFHFEYAMSAIRAGKHFLVEKPMALGVEQNRLLAAAAKECNTTAMVGFVYRFSDGVQQARRIAQERLGKIYTTSAWFGGKRLADPTIPLEWRMLREYSGSGALGDFGTHLVDLSDFIAGQRFERVSCMTKTVIPQRMGRDGLTAVENDDNAVFTAESSQGLGSFTVSRTGMDAIMLMVTGEGGMLQLSLREPEVLTFWEKKPSGGYSGAEQISTFGGVKSFDRWFNGEMTAFLDEIEGKQTLAADVQQGLYVEEVLYAAEKAATSGKAEQVMGV